MSSSFWLRFLCLFLCLLFGLFLTVSADDIDRLDSLFSSMESLNDSLDGVDSLDLSSGLIQNETPEASSSDPSDDLSLISVGPNDFPSQFTLALRVFSNTSNAPLDGRPLITFYLPKSGYTGSASFSSSLFDDRRFQWLAIDIIPKLGDNLIGVDKSGNFSLSGFFVKGYQSREIGVDFVSLDFDQAILYLPNSDTGSGFKGFSGSDINLKFSGSKSNYSVSWSCPASASGVSKLSLYIPFQDRCVQGEDGSVGFVSCTFSSEEIDESSSGLLASIIDFLKNIVSCINKVRTAITELPSKIVSLFKDALKDLFIPTQDQFNALADSFKSSLSSHLGFVYSAGDTIFDFFQSLFTGENAKTTISFPVVTIPFSKVIPCNDFKFGPYEVPIIPDGTPSVLVNSVRTITSGILILAFFNFGRRLFDKILGDKGDDS